jgi:hypothetical protein
VAKKVAGWLFLSRTCYNQAMMQRRKYRFKRIGLLTVIGCVGILTLVLFQLPGGGKQPGGQATAATGLDTVMQGQRPAIDLALPLVTENALFALG